MVRRSKPGAMCGLIAGGMLGLLGLTAIAMPLSDPTFLPGFPPAGGAGNAGRLMRPELLVRTAESCVCPHLHQEGTTHHRDVANAIPGPLRARAIAPRTIEARVDRNNQDDARSYLLQAAAAGRPAGTGSLAVETRTVLWMNAPASIASSSLPEASPPP